LIFFSQTFELREFGFIQRIGVLASQTMPRHPFAQRAGTYTKVQSGFRQIDRRFRARQLALTIYPPDLFEMLKPLSTTMDTAPS
jgi:hypothetical protein